MGAAAWILAIGIAVAPMLVIVGAVRSRSGSEKGGRQSILRPDARHKLEIVAAAAWVAPVGVLAVLLALDKPFETALFGMFVAFALTLNAYLVVCLVLGYRRRRPLKPK